MFHPGELKAQQKAGFTPPAAAIYTAMPQQHRLFYAGLSQFYFSVAGADGYPVAGILQGAPGFVQALDETHLRIVSGALNTFPGFPELRPGMAAGGLGLDFSNRRRNRVNGVIESVTPDFITLAVRESFGNCPQYIQRRNLPESESQRLPESELLVSLDADARYLVAAADTFFIASRAPEAGADISHRGGPPGFIGLQQGKLKIADYAGNRYMNTLGNLLLEPRCALLIPDFHQGAALHIQGRAEIIWQQAERYLLVTPERITRLRQLLPAAGLAVEYAASTLAINKKG
ncbi:pyridoxamine 5'-phosphate oxidase family protein [Kalamiella sp. sgz302252]|uniref:pyridoxamine 5'-phosphate oxidase family protein n=1 Tax=Pantoea sp. sgz302252 TaxID=3341827 RepID=UPI0036D30791